MPIDMRDIKVVMIVMVVLVVMENPVPYIYNVKLQLLSTDLDAFR